MRLTTRREAQLVPTLADLQAMPADGWPIDPPIVRQQVPDRPNGARRVDAILWRDGRVRLLTLPDEGALRDFAAEQQLEISG